MKKLLVLTSLLSGNMLLLAQSHGIEWQRTYGGSALEQATSVCTAQNGGYVIAGSSNSADGDVTGNHGSHDLWIVKINEAGEMQWQKSIGGKEYDGGTPYIQPTKDGGYILSATSFAPSNAAHGDIGSTNGLVVKIDKSGNTIWSKLIGGSGHHGINSIQQTRDGGYILAGYSDSTSSALTKKYSNTDYWIAKLNPKGDIIWSRSFGLDDQESACRVLQTADGGYVAAGTSLSYSIDEKGALVYGYSKGWISKFDASGNIIWNRSLGSALRDESLYGLEATGDGGFIITGTSTDIQTRNSKGWMVKVDASGNIEWDKLTGKTGNSALYDIHQLADGNYIVAGNIEVQEGTADHAGQEQWVLELDRQGNILWQTTLGGEDSDYAYAIQQAGKDAYIIAGATLSEKGDITNNQGLMDYWIVKLSTKSLNATGIKDPLTVTIYPNPARDSYQLSFDARTSVNVTVTITDAQGRNVKELYKGELPGGKKMMLFDTNGLEAGIYFITVSSATGIIKSSKLVIDK